jgi:hypothetical protein
MAVILTRSAGTGSGSASGGAYTQDDKLAMELEMAFKAAKLSNYREFAYASGDLTTITIYETDAKIVTLFTKGFTYDVNGDLTQLLLTRDTDGAQLLKIFAYTDGDLTSIEASAGP